MTLSAAELDRVASLVQQGPYEGYPALEDRLYLNESGLFLRGSTLIVPEGPWQVSGHPNRRGASPTELDPDVPSPGHPILDTALQRRWRTAGLTLDQYGRPVHPDWLPLLADKRIGLPTGVGYFWRYGPNTTVEAAIYRRAASATLEILLIRRRDGGQWALPGGFTARTDRTPQDTARREAGEETGLRELGGWAEVIAQNRSVGPMATLNAWTENSVVLVHGDAAYLADTDLTPGDDAVDAAWFTPDRIPLDLFDVHAQHIETVLRRLASQPPL